MTKILTMLVAATLSLAVGSAASAAVTEPGVAGTANCKGQTVAYLADGGALPGLLPARGIGQVANVNNMSVAGVMSVLNVSHGEAIS